MKRNKAQITLFLIFGFIIAIAIGLVYTLNTTQIPGKNKAEIEKLENILFLDEGVRNYLNICLQNIAKEGLILIGQQGGYFNLQPPARFENSDVVTPYYFYEGLNLVPPLKTIEDELSKFVNAELHFCTENITIEGYSKEVKENTNTTVIIGKNSIIIKTNYPITFKKDGHEYDIKEFSANIDNFRLKILYDLVNTIINKQVENPNNICLSCILNITTINNFDFRIGKVSNDTIIFILKDNNSKIENIPYEFSFANKYKQFSCTNLPPDADYLFLSSCIEKEIKKIGYKLELEDIPNFSVKINEEFTYDVNASGANLTFLDYTNLFDINKKTGLIKFIPKEEDIGNYFVWISTKDGLGNEDYENFEINLTK